MTKKMDRRAALKIMGAGALGVVGLAAGIANREKLIAFLDHDKEQNQANVTPIDTLLYKPANKQLSRLGFGCMRFPTKSGDAIDTELTEKMIDYAYRRGVNYFDTAYIYHGGKSETVIGQILKKYPRESFFLVDKMPAYMVSSLADAKHIFQEQLDRCQTTYFDNYLLHYLHDREEFDRVYIKQGVLDYLRSERAAGRIKHLGFSYHGNQGLLDYLVDNFPWEFVMIQLNYQDWNEPEEPPHDARIEGSLYRKLEAKGLPVFVMEPVKGGRLAKLSEEDTRVLKSHEPQRSIASWAIRFAASHQNVVTVLSGMSDLNQVVDNINTMTDFKPLTEAEQKLVQNPAGNAGENDKLINCTNCKYCMPCPYGVDIPGNFQLFNKYGVAAGEAEEITAASFSKEAKAFLIQYKNSLPKAAWADHCIRCGKCLSKCPQHLPIPQHMRKIDALVAAVKKADGRGTI